jgi:predicted amidohydrolase
MKIAIVQLNLNQYRLYNDFFSHMENIIKKAKDNDADLVVFPEDINLCILWTKYHDLSAFTIKPILEHVFEFIISRINLSWMKALIATEKQSKIIENTCSILAKKYNVNICTGTYYQQIDNNLFNICSFYDRNGNLIDKRFKYKLVGIEKAWGVKSVYNPVPVLVDDLKVGLAICFDINDPDYIKDMVSNGSEVILVPSNGYRIFPWYPFDESKETPHRQRAIENNVPILRPYCCGWLFPGLYFRGSSEIVNKKGLVLAKPDSKDKEQILYFNMEDA